MNNDQFVFISYAHLDSNVVLPCVEAMRQSHISVWYDNGIQAGSEWPEYIAEKVVSCTKFVLFVSNAYLQSQNCKRELNFAISQKKNILSIFIEDVHLSPGMEMQLGTYQAIYRNRFSSDFAFRASICTEQYFDDCRAPGAPTISSMSEQQKANTANTTSSFTSGTTTSSGGNTNTQNTAGAGTASSGAAFNNVFTGQGNSVFDTTGAATKTKNRYLAAFLAIFFGTFGIHKFYLGQPKTGILYILFFWTYIPTFVSFFEGLGLLFSSQAKLEKKHKCKFE